MIVTRTPYRMSFFGGGTDYNSWFEENGGLIIGSAFAKYCWISVRQLPPFFSHRTRLCYSVSEEVESWQAVRHPGVRSALKFMNMEDGFEIHLDGDLPAKSGIGSSSSFTVGFLLALHAVKNELLTKRELADRAIFVEQKVEGQNVGIQDQIFAAYGGLQTIDMGPGNRFTVTPLILPRDYRKQLESHVLLGFTGLTRFASDSAKSQIENIKRGEVTSQLQEILGIAREAMGLFQKNADMKELGKLFHATWKVKRTLSQSVSNSMIDSLYETALKNGAFGGRLLGAGKGGFFLFFAPPEKHAQIKAALKEIKIWVPFAFDEDGAKIILHHRR